MCVYFNVAACVLSYERSLAVVRVAALPPLAQNPRLHPHAATLPVQISCILLTKASWLGTVQLRRNGNRAVADHLVGNPHDNQQKQVEPLSGCAYKFRHFWKGVPPHAGCHYTGTVRRPCSTRCSCRVLWRSGIDCRYRETQSCVGYDITNHRTARWKWAGMATKVPT